MDIGGVEIAGLLIGIVEYLKRFGIDGKATEITALAVGLVLFGLSEANAQDLLSPTVVSYLTVGIRALAWTLASMGYFKLARRAGLQPRL